MASQTSSFTGVCKRDLGINDHHVVFHKVMSISAKWVPFARSLHLDKDTIDVIKEDHDGSESKNKLCMSMVLDYWLRKKNYEFMRYGSPCWRKVCEAVIEGGGDSELAEAIAREHPLQIHESAKTYIAVKKLYELQAHFSQVLCETEKSFKECKLLPDIIDYLPNHIIALLGKTNKESIAGEIVKEFKCITTISDLFNILQHKYLSWFNYKVIVHLVNFLSTNKTLKKTWERYEEELEDYFDNSHVFLKDVEDVQFGEFNSPLANTKVMVAEVDHDNYTLNHLFFLRKALPKTLNIPDFEFYFSFVSSSLHLEYWIPDFLYSVIFPLLNEQEKSLASIGIIKLSCLEYSQQLEKPHLLPSDNGKLYLVPWFTDKAMCTPICTGIPNNITDTHLPFAGVSSRDLGIKDHNTVYTKVKEISSRWSEFAGSLHLERNTIEKIKATYPTDCDQCMIQALDHWLRRNYDYRKYGTPCWRMVCIAVEDGGKDPALAQTIANENCLPPRSRSSNIYVSPQKRNYEMLDKLYELQGDFSDAIFRTIMFFEQELNLSVIITYLKTHLNTLLGPHWAKKPEAALAIEEFDCKGTIPDLFVLLQQKYLSWFNYQLIIKLVDAFSKNNDALKGIWLNYEEKLEEYFMKSGGLLKDAEGIQFGECNTPPPGSKVMTVCVDRDDYTLDHLFFLRKALPKELNVDEYDFYLSFISIGSLHLEYWIPSPLHSFIFPLSIEQEVGLASLGIAEMSDEDGEYSYDLNKLQESKSTHNELLLTNGFKEDIQLRNEPKNGQFEISFTKMKDIILHETIPCNLFLIAFLGLPFSRKSILVHSFLKEAAYTISNGLDPLSTIEYNEKGLSVYNTRLMQHNSDKYLWFTLEKELKEAHPFSSAILSMSYLHDYSLNIVFNGDANQIFQNTILDAHFGLVCKSVKQIDLTQCNYELQRMLSSRMVDVNIIDDGTNAGATIFLDFIFNHLSYNLGFVCLSINDVLNRPPNPSHKSADIMAINTRVLHIIRDGLKMHSSEAPFIFIIICSERDTKSDRKIAKDMLLREVTNINDRLGLRPFCKTTALVLDPCSLKDMKELRNELDGEINRQCILRKDIKLSWLFLRSALCSSSEDIVIPYERLKDIAEKLGIKEMEVKEFLEMFSKFMSILYFPSFKPLQNVVILRPVEFINTLSLLFRIPDGKTNFNGLYTIELIDKIIPNKKLAGVIIDALCSFGLAMKMKSDPFIFVPLANNGNILEKSTTTNTSLFILYESKVNLCDCQCFFASQLLITQSQGPSITKFSLQVGLEHRNIFKVFLQTTQHQEDYTFSFIFHDTYIEVACATLRSNVEFNVFEYIFNCCSEALSTIANTVKDFSYKLALKCLTPPSKPTYDLIDSATKGFEFFLQSKSPWCHECKSSTSPQRKYWKELIEKKKDKEKQREPVNIEKLLEWAQKIGPHITSKQKLNNFAQKLSVKIDDYYLPFLCKECPPWQRVFTIFSILDKRNEATREKIEAAVVYYLSLPREILD